eukprot:7613114-Pyramimonas_sp.AAC.1
MSGIGLNTVDCGPDARCYYYNSQTGVSQWERPEETGPVLKLEKMHCKMTILRHAAISATPERRSGCAAQSIGWNAQMSIGRNNYVHEFTPYA